MREARLALETERGERLDDRELFRTLCARALEPQGTESTATPRPRHQLAVTVCTSCEQGWQTGSGLRVALRPQEVSLAMCDAHEIGSLDAPPGRPTSTIPAATRRLIFERDGGRCTVPGCRSARNLDVHHIRFREHGGGHEPENLTVLCDGHHAALHDGTIRIAGKAPNITVTRRWEVPPPDKQSHVGLPLDDRSHVGPRTDDRSHVGQQAIDADALLALTTLGFTKRESRSALDAAREDVSDDANLETVIRAALRNCPRARG
jgi:hypothetical protein